MNTRKLRPFFALSFAAVVLAILSGCANQALVRVHPWERSTLADYTMRSDRDPSATMLTQHVYFSREAATGGFGVGGSGCGCND